MTRVGGFLAFGVVLLTLCASAEALAPTRTSDKAEPARLEELNARFLLDAFRARALLRKQGPADIVFADSFWSLAGEFSEIVDRAEGEERSLFLPLLTAMQQTLEEGGLASGTPDMTKLSAIRDSLAEQVEVHRALGSTPGARRGTDFRVFAFRGPGQPLPGLTVWVDLACCVLPRTSAQPLQRLTNEARGRGRPGTYMIRLRQAGRTIACRKALIRRSSGQIEPVELSAADRDC